MTQARKSLIALLGSAALSLALFGCGGGGYSAPKPQPMPNPYGAAHLNQPAQSGSAGTSATAAK